MEAISLPNRVKIQSLGENKYLAELEPLYPGYGVTIGNAMRRVLLSSMPGSAITAVKMKFVDHEFSTIPNVREDVIQIILNLKQVRVKSFSLEPVKLILKVKGEKIVTAADIKGTDQVEIINTNQYIATLDNKASDLDMELIVEQGRGYVPVEAREHHKTEIGMISIDSVFTPVRSVHFDVSNVRVGQLTNFDKLEIFLETDGSLTGNEAIDVASHILVDHFTMLFADAMPAFGEISKPEIESEAAVPPAQNPQEISENEISNSTLSTRAKNALAKKNITAFSQLQSMTSGEILNIEGLGEKTVREILDFLGRKDV